MKDFQTDAAERFSEKTMRELAGILKISDETALEAFRHELVDMCAHYRAVISALPCDLPGAPSNISLTKRADWLEINVIKPAERLLKSLEPGQKPMFATWPYPLTVPEFQDHSDLRNELAALQASSAELRDSLRGQQSEDAGHNQELRAEIFSAVAIVLRRHCADAKPNRGVYDAGHQRRIGTYVDAVTLIYSKVTGLSDNLDRLIRTEIRVPS